MNIVQISERLKGVPKSFLVKEANPATSSGRYPAFLVISELNRRNAMAKQFKNSEAMTQVVQSTVTDKTINEATQPPMGINIMASKPPPVPTMAAAAQGIKNPMITAKEGGMIKYDEPTGQETMGIPGVVRMYEGGRVSFSGGGELRKRLDELDAEIAKFMQTNKALPVNLIRQRENILNTLKPTTDQTELPGEEDLLQDIVPMGVQSKNVNPRAMALQNQTTLPDNQGITSNRDLLRPRGTDEPSLFGTSLKDVRKNQIEKMLEEGKSGIRGLPLSNEKRAELEAELATLNKQLQPEKEATSEMEMTGKIPTYLLNEEARKELEKTKVVEPETKVTDTDTDIDTDTELEKDGTDKLKVDKPEKVDGLDFDSVTNMAKGIISKLGSEFGGTDKELVAPQFAHYEARTEEEFLESRNKLRKTDIVGEQQKLINNLKDQNEKDRLQALNMFMLQSGLSILSAPSQGRGFGAELGAIAKALGVPLTQLQGSLQKIRQGERDITKAEIGLLQTIGQQQESDVKAFDAELRQQKASEVAARNMTTQATFDLAKMDKNLTNDRIKMAFNFATNKSSLDAKLKDSDLNRESRERLAKTQIKSQEKLANITAQNKFNTNNIKTVDDQIKVLNKSIIDAEQDKIKEVGKAIGDEAKREVAQQWDFYIAQQTQLLNGYIQKRNDLASGGGNIGITSGEAGQGTPYKNLFDFSQSKPSKSGNMYVPYQMPR